MSEEDKSSWSKNLTLLSLIAGFLSLAEKLLPVVFSTWNDYLRQKNQNLKAEVDLLKTKEVIRTKIRKVDLSSESLKYIEDYINKESKNDV
jgi:hypothetical protein